MILVLPETSRRTIMRSNSLIMLRPDGTVRLNCSLGRITPSKSISGQLDVSWES